MEVLLVILAILFVIGRISAGSARARKEVYKQESKDELVQRMLNDYN